MGDAYTPGLLVTGDTLVRKTRRLPLTGGVVVDVGQDVKARDIVARTELPGTVHLLNFSNKLGVAPDEIADALQVQPGAEITKGQLMAHHRAFFGLIRSSVEAPINGVFESVSKITGQAILRESPRPVEVNAYIDGTVVEEIPKEGVIVEARATMVQGIFGLAGETHAELVLVAERPDQDLLSEHLTPDHAGKIVIGGARATLGAMRRAMELGVAGIVVGGFAYHDIRELLGFDVGVAITGTEDLPTTLVVTEGFGDIAMATATFELLARHAGEQASINGATQIRAGVIRPEVVIPHSRNVADDEDSHTKGLDVGVSVRCIRAPYFGHIGEVTGLPVELFVMPSESKVRVCEVELENGETVTVPRANVEVIER